MIRGFFFDLDGTLVDTHQANFEAYRRAIKDVSGIEITLEQFKTSIGHVASTFLPWFVPDADAGVYERIAVQKATYYKELIHMTKLNTGLVAFMNLMAGSKMVLVTTAKPRNAEAVLNYHKLTHYFDLIITAEDVQHSKPAPDAYILALKQTGLKPDEVVVFEDSDSGRRAAEAVGLSVALINTFNL